LQWDSAFRAVERSKIIGDLGVKGEKPIAYGEFKTEFLNPMHDAIQGKEFAKFLKPDDFYTGNVNMDAVRQSLADDPATLAKIEELQNPSMPETNFAGPISITFWRALMNPKSAG